jgi:hypothetical protein
VTLSISGLGFLDETEVGSIADDDAPPWTQDQIERADLYHGDKLIRRGQPQSGDNLSAEPEPPHQLPCHQLPNNAGTDWRTFGNDLIKRLRAAETKADAFEWLDANKALLTEMEDAVPKMFESLNKTIDAIRDEPS